MIAIRKESAEVLYPEEDVVIVTAADLDELKQLALQNPRRRVRLCAHRSPQDHLHEMFIVHTSNCYVRPHKHLGKAESMTVLDRLDRWDVWENKLKRYDKYQLE